LGWPFFLSINLFSLSCHTPPLLQFLLVFKCVLLSPYPAPTLDDLLLILFSGLGRRNTASFGNLTTRVEFSFDLVFVWSPSDSLPKSFYGFLLVMVEIGTLVSGCSSAFSSYSFFSIRPSFGCFRGCHPFPFPTPNLPFCVRSNHRDVEYSVQLSSPFFPPLPWALLWGPRFPPFLFFALTPPLLIPSFPPFRFWPLRTPPVVFLL